MQCTHCGSNLSADDLRGADCKYCGTVLPHHAKAAEKAALVQQLFADANGNGIPDAFEGALGANAADGSFVSIPSAGGGVAARVKVTASVSSRVIVNGVVQPDGAVPEDVARTLASAGVSLPGVRRATPTEPSRSARWVGIAVAIVVGVVAAGVLVAALW